MVDRAEKRRNDATSSFPSRAVACGITYSYILSGCIILGQPVFHIAWWMPLLIIVIALLSTYARIYLGCHYMSDCLVGMLMGVVSCAIGTGLYAANRSMCSACATGACYVQDGTDAVISLSSMSRINWLVITIGSVIAVICVLIAEMKPMNMWNKSSHVLGMLLPCIVFRLTFVCSPFAHSALVAPLMPPHVGGYFVAIALVGICTVCSLTLYTPLALMH